MSKYVRIGMALCKNQNRSCIRIQSGSWGWNGRRLRLKRPCRRRWRCWVDAKVLKCRMHLVAKTKEEPKTFSVMRLKSGDDSANLAQRRISSSVNDERHAPHKLESISVRVYILCLGLTCLLRNVFIVSNCLISIDKVWVWTVVICCLNIKIKPTCGNIEPKKRRSATAQRFTRCDRRPRKSRISRAHMRLAGIFKNTLCFAICSEMM